MFKYSSWHNYNGMLPLNSLYFNARIIKFCKFSPIHVGTLPNSLFSPRSKNTKAVQFCNGKGSSPVIWFLSNCGVLRCINWPIEFGICPERWLLAKFKMNKLCLYGISNCLESLLINYFWIYPNKSKSWLQIRFHMSVKLFQKMNWQLEPISLSGREAR